MHHLRPVGVSSDQYRLSRIASDRHAALIAALEQRVPHRSSRWKRLPRER